MYIIVRKGEFILKRLVCTLFFTALLIAGCSGEKTIEVNDSRNSEQSEMVKEVIRDTNEVHSGAAVLAEDQLLVAVQAKPWLDFKKRKIEKSMQKQLEEKFTDLKVLVSTDYKLYWETKKLLHETDEQKVIDEVKKLKKLAKEET